MKVETFECEEVAAEDQLDTEAIREAVHKLGLTGQNKFFGDNATPARIPYRLMTAEEHFVYSNILPKRTNVRKYEDAPIPIRVLQVISHADPLFDNVEIWHPQAATEKDPLAVGICGGTTPMFYLLARWGDVLDAYESLKAKALAKWRARLSSEWTQEINDRQARLETLKGLDFEQAASLVRENQWLWR